MKTKVWKVTCFVLVILVLAVLTEVANSRLCDRHGCVIDSATESTQVTEQK